MTFSAFRPLGALLLSGMLVLATWQMTLELPAPSLHASAGAPLA